MVARPQPSPGQSDLEAYLEADHVVAQTPVGMKSLDGRRGKLVRTWNPAPLGFPSVTVAVLELDDRSLAFLPEGAICPLPQTKP